MIQEDLELLYRQGSKEEYGEWLDWALAYARMYWQFGHEPETQAALTILAREVTTTE